MKQDKTDKLYAARRKHSEAINQIDEKIRDAERDIRLKRLGGYVGKYFEGAGNTPSFREYFYVLGISKDTMGSRVLRVIKNGDDDDPWFTFEEVDCMGDMAEERPSKKGQFDAVLAEIQKRVVGYFE